MALLRQAGEDAQRGDAATAGDAGEQRVCER